MKNAPLTRAADYLRKLPKDVSNASGCVREAEDTTNLKQNFKDEFIKTFKAHELTLKNYRDKLETIVASRNAQDAAAILDNAHAAVNSFRSDSKSFKRSCDVYAKEKERLAKKTK